VDADGLPHVGAVVYPGQAYACVVDGATGRAAASKLKGEEVGVVDRVTVVGGLAGAGGPASRATPGIARANVVMRLHRRPVVGDKFSSRHGQKGVLSRLWPDADLPYAEATGMRPDLLINPHAFPSRMTIGMLVESLAAKAGALGGHFVDATPFAGMGFGEGAAAHPAATFGEALERAGFARNGAETLICGSTGLAFAADIFIGPVYYQRLRHMVSDKFQVRSTGPVNALTRQPIKGRKFGGGIRFGEMERDALLSHGASALLFDRLHASSDYSVADVCGGCGSLLAPAVLKRAAGTVAAHLAEAGGRGELREGWRGGVRGGGWSWRGRRRREGFPRLLSPLPLPPTPPRHIKPVRSPQQEGHGAPSRGGPPPTLRVASPLSFLDKGRSTRTPVAC
jgi:DNA-directed RNA polymerase I subunit RPA2